MAVGVVLVWAVTGPLFGYSDSWQLVINLEEEDLDRIRAGYEQLAERARAGLQQGKRDTGVAELAAGTK
jgi:hypothetical protein